MSAVWEYSKQEGGALRLMLAIADHADDSGIAYPGIERLARKARLTERQIYRLLQQLIKSGEIGVEHGGGRHRVNVYRINVGLLRKGDEMSGMTKCQGLSDRNPDIHVTETLTPASQNPDAHVTPTVIDPSSNHKIDDRAPDTQRKRERTKRVYSHEFDQAMALYPSRAQGNPKPPAYRAWCARIKDGVSPEEIIAGVRRYTAYIQATGSAFIKQASTFFGPDEFWKQPWGVPAERGSSGPQRPTPRKLQTLHEMRQRDREAAMAG